MVHSLTLCACTHQAGYIPGFAALLDDADTAYTGPVNSFIASGSLLDQWEASQKDMFGLNVEGDPLADDGGWIPPGVGVGSFMGQVDVYGGHDPVDSLLTDPDLRAALGDPLIRP